MTFQEFGEDCSRRNRCCCAFLTFLLLLIILIISLIVQLTNPLCIHVNCKSERVRILGEVVRYPKRIGFRTISENSVNFLQALKNRDKVILSSLHSRTGIFVAKFLKGSSKEFAVFCPTEIFYNDDSEDCIRTDKSIDLALDSWTLKNFEDQWAYHEWRHALWGATFLWRSQMPIGTQKYHERKGSIKQGTLTPLYL